MSHVLDFLDWSWVCIVSAEHWLDTNFSSAGLIAIPAIVSALLMPIAIFLMERQDKYEFDKSVIVDKILFVKWLIPAIILSSIVLVYHSSLLSFICSLILLIITGLILVRTYKWTKSYEATLDKLNYRQHMRMNYLGGLKTDNDRLDVWTMILNDEDLLEKNQQGLIDRFIKTVKSMTDGDGVYPRTNMHLLLINNLKKINFSNREAYDKLLAYSLEYFDQHQAWKRALSGKASEQKSKEPAYPEYYLEELMEQMMQFSLGKSQSHSVFDYLFFKQIKKYIEKGTTDMPIFAEEFLTMYIRTIKTDDKSKIDNLWEKLPDWTITRERIEKKETRPMAIALMRSYMDNIGQDARLNATYSSRQIKVIENVTGNLFPKISTILWFEILTLYTSGWGLNDGEDSLHGQIRNYIESSREFGLWNSTGLMNWDPDEDSNVARTRALFEEQDREAMYLLGIYFPWLRNPSELQKVIDMIKIMQPEKREDKDGTQRRRLDGLLYDFERLLEFTNNEVTVSSKKKGKKK